MLKESNKIEFTETIEGNVKQLLEDSGISEDINNLIMDNLRKEVELNGQIDAGNGRTPNEIILAPLNNRLTELRKQTLSVNNDIKKLTAEIGRQTNGDIEQLNAKIKVLEDQKQKYESENIQITQNIKVLKEHGGTGGKKLLLNIWEDHLVQLTKKLTLWEPTNCAGTNIIDSCKPIFL